jgi:regulator of replication initiation timing
MRRHPGITFMQLPDPMHSENEHLRLEIKELKERLSDTERQLHRDAIQDNEVNIDFTLCNNEHHNT